MARLIVFSVTILYATKPHVSRKRVSLSLSLSLTHVIGDDSDRNDLTSNFLLLHAPPLSPSSIPLKRA
jgi:hypothetical protein